jgi:hypothetical protein
MYDSNSNSQVLSLKFQTEGTENVTKVFQTLNKNALETSSMFTDLNKVTYDSVAGLDKLTDGLLKVGSTAKSLPGFGAESILGVEQKTWGGLAQQADLFNSALGKLGEEQQQAGIYGKLLQKDFFKPTMNFFDTIVSPMDRVLGKQGFINKATESLQMLNKNDLLENVLKNGSKTVKDIAEGMKTMGEEFTPLANTFLKVSASLEKGGKLVDIIDKIEDVKDVLETTKENILGLSSALGTAVPMVASMAGQTEGVYGVALKANIATGLLNNTIFATGNNFSKLGTPIKAVGNELLSLAKVPEAVRNSFDGGFSSVLSTLDNTFSKGGKYADTFFAKVSQEIFKFEIAFGLTVLASLKAFMDIGGEAEKVFMNFNKGLESLQGIGIDTSLIQLRESMGAFGENLLFNIDATKQLKNITTQLNDELEKTGNYIQTLGADSTKNIDDLKDSLRSLSKELGNAVYAADLGISVYNNLSAGIGTASGKLQDAVNVSKSAVKYAIATQGDINAVQEATIFAMQSYKKSAEDTTALFNELVKQGITNTQQLQNYVGRLTAVGQAAGISMEELFRSTSIATKTLGEDAYLAIERLILSFSNMTPQAAKALEKYNLSITQIAATIKDPDKGIYGVMELLKNAGVTTASALSEIIPESVALRGALALLNTDANTAKETLESMKNADFGDIEKSFTKSQETVEAKGIAITNIFKDIFTQAGEELEKSGITKAAVSGLDYFAEKFQELQPTFVQVAKFSIVVNEGLEKLLQVLGLVGKSVGVIVGLFAMFVLEIRMFPFLGGLAKGFNSVGKSANVLTKILGGLDGGLRGIFGLQDRMNDTIPSSIGLINTWKEGWGKLTGQISAFKQEFTGISTATKGLDELNTSPMFNPKSNLVSNLKNIGAVFSKSILSSVRSTAVEMKILREQIQQSYDELQVAQKNIGKTAIEDGSVNDSKIIKEQLGKNLTEYEKHYADVEKAKKQAAQAGNVEGYNAADAELKQLDQQKQKLGMYNEEQLKNVRTYETQSKAIGDAINLREGEMEKLDKQLKMYEKSFHINTDLEKQRLGAIKDINNTKSAIQENNKAIASNDKAQLKLLYTQEQLQQQRQELFDSGQKDTQQFKDLTNQYDENIKKIKELGDSTSKLQAVNSELTPTLAKQEAQFKSVEGQIKGNTKELKKGAFAINVMKDSTGKLWTGLGAIGSMDVGQAFGKMKNAGISAFKGIGSAISGVVTSLKGMMVEMLPMMAIGAIFAGVTNLLMDWYKYSQDANKSTEFLNTQIEILNENLNPNVVKPYFEAYAEGISKAVKQAQELQLIDLEGKQNWIEKLQTVESYNKFMSKSVELTVLDQYKQKLLEIRKQETEAQRQTILNSNEFKDLQKEYIDSGNENVLDFTNLLKTGGVNRLVIESNISLVKNLSNQFQNFITTTDSLDAQITAINKKQQKAIDDRDKAYEKHYNKAKSQNTVEFQNAKVLVEQYKSATQQSLEFRQSQNKLDADSINMMANILYNVESQQASLDYINEQKQKILDKEKEGQTLSQQDNKDLEYYNQLLEDTTKSQEKQIELRKQYKNIMNKIMSGNSELTSAERKFMAETTKQQYEQGKAQLENELKVAEAIRENAIAKGVYQKEEGQNAEKAVQKAAEQLRLFEENNKKSTEYALEYYKAIDATSNSLASIKETYTDLVKDGSIINKDLTEISKLLQDPKTTDQEKENLKVRQANLNQSKEQLSLFNQTAQSAFTQNPKISESIENTSKDYIRAYNTMTLEADKFTKGEGANFDVMKESIIGSVIALSEFYTNLSKPEDAVKGIDEILNKTIQIYDPETKQLVEKQFRDLFSPEEIEQIVNESIVEGMNNALTNALRPQEQFLKQQKALLDTGEQDRLSYLKNAGKAELDIIDQQIANKNKQIDYLINTKGIDENNETVIKLKDELFQLETDKQIKHKDNIKGILDESFAQQLQSYEKFNVDLEKQLEAGLLTESEFIEERQRMQRNDVLARLSNVNAQLAVEKVGSDEYKKLLIEKSKIELEYTKTLKSQGAEDTQRILDLQLQEYTKYNITLEKMLLSGQVTREQYEKKDAENKQRGLVATIENINAKLAVEKEGSDEYNKLINERLKAQLDLQKQIIDKSITDLQQSVDKQKLILEVDTGNLEKIVSQNELVSRELELQNNLRKLEVDLAKEQLNMEVEILNNQVKVSNDLTDRAKLQTQIVVKQIQLKEEELKFEKESILFSVEKNKLDNEQKKIQLQINKIKLQGNKLDLQLEINKAKLNNESELKVKQLNLQLDRLNEEITLNDKNAEFQAKENELVERQADTQLQILNQRQELVRQNGVYDLELAKNAEIIAALEEQLQKINVKNQTEELHYKKVLGDVDKITQAYDQQLKLINKQKENASNIVDFYSQLGQKYAELSSSEIVKYKTERQIAKFKIEAYFKQQESERKSFEYAQLSEKLAAKRLLLESQIAESKARAAILEANVEAQKVLARQDATEEEKALAMLQVQNAEMSYNLQKDSTKLAMENLGIQEQIGKINAENFNRKQQMDKVNLLTEGLSSRAGETKKSELMSVIEGIMQPTNQLIQRQSRESENRLYNMMGINEKTLKANQKGISDNFEQAFSQMREQKINTLDTTKLESSITGLTTKFDANTLAQGIKYNLDNNFSVKSILPTDNPINSKLDSVSTTLKSFLESSLQNLSSKVDNVVRALSGNKVNTPTSTGNSKSLIESLIINIEGTKDMDETELANKIVEVLNTELIDTSNELLRRLGA